MTTHHSTITDPKELGVLLNTINTYEGSFEVYTAINLMQMLFVRSGELHYAYGMTLTSRKVLGRSRLVRHKGELVYH